MNSVVAAIAELLNDPEPAAYIVPAAAHFTYWFAKENAAAAIKVTPSPSPPAAATL